jgi:hypothetical protein
MLHRDNKIKITLKNKLIENKITELQNFILHANILLDNLKKYSIVNNVDKEKKHRITVPRINSYSEIIPISINIEYDNNNFRQIMMDEKIIKNKTKSHNYIIKPRQIKPTKNNQVYLYIQLLPKMIFYV